MKLPSGELKVGPLPCGLFDDESLDAILTVVRKLNALPSEALLRREALEKKTQEEKKREEANAKKKRENARLKNKLGAGFTLRSPKKTIELFFDNPTGKEGTGVYVVRLVSLDFRIKDFKFLEFEHAWKKYNRFLLSEAAVLGA